MPHPPWRCVLRSACPVLERSPKGDFPDDHHMMEQRFQICLEVTATAIAEQGKSMPSPARLCLLMASAWVPTKITLTAVFHAAG
jgi:hypothetical protein